MGFWQWRKSFGRGPFRINLSRKGVGYSIGVPGLRVGSSPAGKPYVSQSIPGTGFRKITYLGKGKTAPPGGGSVATRPTLGSPPSLPSPAAAPGAALGARPVVPLSGRSRWRTRSAGAVGAL
jgi:hypothetical protein